MTRVEELTLLLVDGQIVRSEREELVRLVTTNAEARRAHLALLTIEATLRGRRRVEISDEVMNRIDEERTSRIVATVMGEVESGRRRAPCLGWRRAGAIALLVTASAAAAITGVRSWAHEDRPVPASAPRDATTARR
jgi:hypothetical protein